MCAVWCVWENGMGEGAVGLVGARVLSSKSFVRSSCPYSDCVFYDAPGSLAVRVCVCVLSTASAASAFAISSFAAAAL